MVEGIHGRVRSITHCYMDIYEILTKEIRGEVERNEPLARHTSYHIGGPADVLVFPFGQEDVVMALEVARESGRPHFVMGGGTNLLVQDRGIRGMTVNLSKYRSEDIDDLEDGTVLRAYAGMKLSRLSIAAEERSLTGLEFAAGIPGTVGGGVVMNAGAFGGEMKDILVSTTVVTKEGQLQALKRAGLVMGYRTVSLPEGSTVLEAVVRLKRGEREVIHRTITEWNRKRKEAQPLEMPSAGSVFRNPEGKKVKDLIRDAELLGFQVGGAQVSLQHGNFIVNAGGATARDVIAVIQEVQERVFRQFGVQLKLEVKIVGEA